MVTTYILRYCKGVIKWEYMMDLKPFPRRLNLNIKSLIGGVSKPSSGSLSKEQWDNINKSIDIIVDRTYEIVDKYIKDNSIDRKYEIYDKEGICVWFELYMKDHTEEEAKTYIKHVNKIFSLLKKDEKINNVPSEIRFDRINNKAGNGVDPRDCLYFSIEFKDLDGTV